MDFSSPDSQSQLKIWASVFLYQVKWHQGEIQKKKKNNNNKTQKTLKQSFQFSSFSLKAL